MKLIIKLVTWIINEINVDRSPQESFKEESVLKVSKLERGRGLQAGRGRKRAGPPHCRWILYQLSHRGSP